MSLPDIPCLTNPSHSYKIHRFHPPPSDQTALPLYIPPCFANPPHRLHPPNHDQPLRIQIEGPLLAVQKILPEVLWHVPTHFSDFPMPGGPKLAELAFRTLYGRDVRPDVSGDMVVRDEYRGWLIEARPVVMIDYYGVTFDHLVPTDDTNPEVLQINIIEIEDDDGAYANKCNPFYIDPTEYAGKKVLAVPRCCQRRKVNKRYVTYSNFSLVARNIGYANPCGVGCDDEDGSAELDCMRQVSFLEISNFMGQHGDRGEKPPMTFGLVADDRIVFGDYEARSNAGEIARVPALLSFTANEFSSLVPWPKDNVTEGPWLELVRTRAIASVCGLFNATMYKNRIAAEAPVFRFQYADVFPNLNVYDWLGAYQNSETTMIFGTYHLLDHIADSTSFQVEISQSMQDHIMAFVKDPYNGPQDALNWLPHDTSDPNGGEYIYIKDKTPGT